MDNPALDIDARIRELELKEGPSNNIHGTYGVAIMDADGNIVSESSEQPCKCFVIGFLKTWYRWLYNGSYVGGAAPIGIDTTFTDGTSGTNALYPYDEQVFSGDLIACAANLDTQGIVIGAGSTPVAIDNTALESKYASTAFTHGQCVAATTNRYEVVGNVMQSKFIRTFSNLSPESAPVNEIGIYTLPYGRVALNGAWWTKTTMIMRDVIPTANVPGYGSIAIAYTLKFNS